MTCLSLVFLLGVAGLAIDIGRMYITKNECQAYVDSAAINAAAKLNGQASGITAASTSTGGDTGKWRFDTQAFSSVTVSFATSVNGTYTTSVPAGSEASYKYVKVAASVNLPMYLIRPLSGPTASIGASAVAYGEAMTTLPQGIFPFSPYTRAAVPDNSNDPYGYQVGHDYTLRWGAPGDKSSCDSSYGGTSDQSAIGTDASAGYQLAENGKIRGYCCVSNSASSLRDAIEGADTGSVTIGQQVSMDNGAKDTEMTAIAYRVNADTDTTSTTYAEYVSSGTGNGERVVTVVVNSGYPNYMALGYATFFLYTPSTYTGLGGNDSACAEYIGMHTLGTSPFGATAPSGPSSTTGYHIRLAQ